MSDVTIDTPDGPMPAAVAEPGVARRGGIVVVHEAFGLTPHIVDVTKRLADLGWLAVAPALFHRKGAPVFEYEGGFEKLAPVFQSLDAEGIATDVTAALGYLGERGITADHAGIVGFCMGGTIAFHAAAQLPVGAAVSFYGGGLAEGRFGLPSLIEQAPRLGAPWLGLYGDLDRSIPVADVEHLREAVADAPVPTEVVRYPGAEHGFNCDHRSSHDPAAAADAWSRTIAWFEAHLS